MDEISGMNGTQVYFRKEAAAMVRSRPFRPLTDNGQHRHLDLYTRQTLHHNSSQLELPNVPYSLEEIMEMFHNRVFHVDFIGFRIVLMLLNPADLD